MWIQMWDCIQIYHTSIPDLIYQESCSNHDHSISTKDLIKQIINDKTIKAIYLK